MRLKMLSHGCVPSGVAKASQGISRRSSTSAAFDEKSIIRAEYSPNEIVVAGSETFDASGLSELMQRVVNVVCAQSIYFGA